MKGDLGFIQDLIHQIPKKRLPMWQGEATIAQQFPA
jgi:hypothetical protein